MCLNGPSISASSDWSIQEIRELKPVKKSILVSVFKLTIFLLLTFHRLFYKINRI